MAKLLFVGESWSTIGLQLKGFALYTTGEYAEGAGAMLSALEAAGHEVTYVRNHEVATRFPADAKALAAYDAFVLSDVAADTFLLHPDTLQRSIVRPDPIAAMAELVAAGKGLLMVGGYMSFSGFQGHACWQNTVLADVLPVHMQPGDDRIERPAGVTPTVVGEHPVLDGITGPWPHFLGYQRLGAKGTAAVPLRVGQDPFLVLAKHGAGRVAAFASDCSPHWGTPEFMAWPHYGRFWGQLTSWLAGEAPKAA